MIEIAPSILSADFARLGEQVTEALHAGLRRIHFDVMDGHFVPNITIGQPVVAALAPVVHQFGGLVEVHLMIDEPDRYLDDFVGAGANVVLVHVETCPHLHRTLQMIHQAGAAGGVVLNPATPLHALDEILPYVDQILLMTVNPGFGGQQFIPSMLAKIAQLRRLLRDRGLADLPIEVDGGVHSETIAGVEQAGAAIAVVGSALFNEHGSLAANLAALQRAMKASR